MSFEFISISSKISSPTTQGDNSLQFLIFAQLVFRLGFFFWLERYEISADFGFFVVFRVDPSCFLCFRSSFSRQIQVRLGMGAVCPGGSFSNQKKEKGLISSPNEAPLSDYRENDYRRTPSMFDTGELRRLSFSSELKPSKPSPPINRESKKVLYSYVS